MKLKRILTEYRFLFIALFLGLFLYLGDQLFLQVSFMSGDYRSQHLPWAVALDSAVKSGGLPLWDPFTHCGFPLLAEGQASPLYPLTFLMYCIFPLKVAYTWSNVSLYFLGLLFMYLFLKRAGLKDFPAAIGGFLFAFGSATAGAYYNTISLKVLAWFPLSLLLIDEYYRDKKVQNLMLLGVIYGMQVLAGYFQYAFYAIIFSSVYYVYSSVWENGKKSPAYIIKDLFSYLIPAALALAVAGPQISESLKLISRSLRGGTSLDFALWGSVNPLGLGTLIFPHFQGFFYGAVFVGVLPLVTVFFLRKKDFNKRLVFLAGLFVFSLILAFGKFTPVLRLFFDASGFYGFRVPAKFLFFSGFALSGIAAFGVSAMLAADPKSRRTRNAVIAWCILAILLVSVLSLANLALSKRDYWLEFGKDYVMKNVYGKPHHKYSLDEYLSRLEPIYRSARNAVSFTNPWIAIGCMSVLTALIFLILFRFGILRKSGFKWIFLAVLAAELFIYNQYWEIRTNTEPLDTFIPEHKAADFLKNDAGYFRIYNVIDRGVAELEEKLPTLPNRSMMYGLYDVGCYTPLVMAEYYAFLGPLGSVDDSIGNPMADPERIEEDDGILDFLNVKYILSLADVPGYEKAAEIDGVKIFTNEDYWPRAFLTEDVEIFTEGDVRSEIVGEDSGKDDKRVYLTSAVRDADIFEPLDVDKDASVDIIEYSRDEVRILAENGKGPAMLVISDLNYPGWKAYVDGKVSETHEINALFRGVLLDEGRHIVTFRYEPVLFVPLLILSAFAYGAAGYSYLVYKLGKERGTAYFALLFSAVVMAYYFNVVLYTQIAGKI